MRDCLIRVVRGNCKVTQGPGYLLRGHPGSPLHHFEYVWSDKAKGYPPLGQSQSFIIGEQPMIFNSLLAVSSVYGQEQAKESANSDLQT